MSFRYTLYIETEIPCTTTCGCNATISNITETTDGCYFTGLGIGTFCPGAKSNWYVDGFRDQCLN